MKSIGSEAKLSATYEHVTLGKWHASIFSLLQDYNNSYLVRVVTRAFISLACYMWLQVAASGLMWVHSTCPLILEQPLLGTYYSWSRGKKEWWQKQSDPKLLLEWATHCMHTHAAGQCYSYKVNISGMSSHSLGDNESHTALSRDVKLKKGGANAQEPSHHGNTEWGTASAFNSTWNLVSTQ